MLTILWNFVFCSPGTRRRTRDRNLPHQHDSSPERRAFQPPSAQQRVQQPMQQPIHPAALPHQGHPPVIIDMDQMRGVPRTNPVTVAPYGLPICTGHIPVCTSAHIPMCTTQPTWSLPGTCSVQFPTCSMQHIPACSIQQIPVTHAIPPILHAHPPQHHIAHPHHPHHQPPHHHQHPHHHHPPQQQQHLPTPTPFLPTRTSPPVSWSVEWMQFTISWYVHVVVNFACACAEIKQN